MCADLGLAADRLDVAMGDLSGGQAARAGLAAILLARFDVFLLDEPTNDLDFAGLDRLEGFLAGLPGAVVVVSHDRAFLDRSVNRIIEIEEGTHRAAEYAGGVERLRRAPGRWPAASRTRPTAATSTPSGSSPSGSGPSGPGRSRACATAKKRPKDHDKAQRGFFVNRTEKQATKVRASEQKPDRRAVDRSTSRGRAGSSTSSLAAAQRSGDVVARLEGAVVRRGPFTLGPVDLEIGWQDRVAVLGPNGGGKSTLLRAILGDLPLAAGRRWAGPAVVFGELDQRRAGLDLGRASVIANFMAATGMLQEEARSLLAKFGLGADHVSRPPAALSPGERTRMILATLMARASTAWCWTSRPTTSTWPPSSSWRRHLNAFEGTLICVTHDRWLLETVRFDRTLWSRTATVACRGMKIYTRKGDDGTTGLLYGGRVAKDDPAIEANGAVDEAQAALGLARAGTEPGSELDGLLIGLERDLYVLMAELATAPGNRSKLIAGHRW